MTIPGSDNAKQLEALLAINKLVMSGADFDNVLEAVVQGTLDVIANAEGAVVEICDGDEMVYRAASGSMAKFVGMRIKIAGSLSGLCVTNEEILYCEDSEVDARVDRVACRKVGICSMIVAPLLHRNRAAGVLKVYSSKAKAFSDNDKLVVQFFVTMIAAGFGSIIDAKAAATMRDLVYTVTHELRTPLTSLKGALELISGLHKVELPMSAQNMLSLALRGSDRLMLLIEDLLTVGKMESNEMRFKMEEIELSTTLAEAVEMMASYREKISFTLEKPPAGTTIYADKSRFLQVVTNLLSNAAKFSPLNSQVDISVLTKGDKVVVSVKDQGKGIPGPMQARIFEKFVQAQSGQGTGLGLYITREIVEKMGGRIWFESEEGRGTVFHVELLANAARFT